jgi:hypothetical protein
MFNTPILLLIFNRPDVTQIVFDIIKQIRPKFLYIGADGPRADKPEDKILCEETRNIVSKIDWSCNVKTLFEDKNLGCGVAPAKAITWFFDHVEQGIILEDDIVPDESFFKFCEETLEYYKNAHNIMHISGCYFLESFIAHPSESYYFTKHIHVWGWATWRRAWKYYDYDMKDWPSLRSKKDLATYYDGYGTFWEEIFDKMIIKGNDIWDYQWMFAIYKERGVAINPTVNLTQNIGFNSKGTHTLNPDSIFTKVKLSSLSEIVRPSAINIHFEKDILYYKHYLDFDLPIELRKRNVIWKLKKLLRKLIVQS